MSQRRTVAATAMAALMEWSAGTGEEVFPEDLAAYAQQLCEKNGMRRIPGASRWATNRAYTDAMQAVIDACVFSGWAPRRYIQAQIESLRLIIERGAVIRPAHLVGVAADDRFKKWVERARFRMSDVRLSSDDVLRKAAKRRAVSAQRFGIAYLRDGLSRDAAAEHAGTAGTPWDWRAAEISDRAVALCAALAVVGARLPHCVLAPAETDAPAWKWQEIKRAFDAFLETDPDPV